jgi:hypothetical protein
LNPYLYNPVVASDGVDALLVWENATTTNPFIQGARVLDDGTVTSLITVNNAPEAQDFPEVAWDGSQYVTLYQDLRNITFFLDERSDIFGTRLEADGTLIDPAGFGVYTSGFPDTDPAVAAANGASLLTAANFHNTSPYMSYRIDLTLMEDGLPTPTPTLTSTATATPPSPSPTPTPTGPPPLPSATPTTIPSPDFTVYLPFAIR